MVDWPLRDRPASSNRLPSREAVAAAVCAVQDSGMLHPEYEQWESGLVELVEELASTLCPNT